MSYMIEISGSNPTKNARIVETVRQDALRQAGVQVDQSRELGEKNTLYAVSLKEPGEMDPEQQLEELNKRLNFICTTGIPEGYGTAKKLASYATVSGAAGAIRTFNTVE